MSATSVRVYVGRDPVTGQERYATRTIRAGTREAERALNEMVVAADRGGLMRSRSPLAALLIRRDTLTEGATVLGRRSCDAVDRPPGLPSPP